MPVEPCGLDPLGSCVAPCDDNEDLCCGSLLGGTSEECPFILEGESLLTPEGQVAITKQLKERQAKKSSSS